MADPHWTTYVSTLLTPIIAGLVGFIVFQQWRTNQNKLKLDLFDRRFAVYDSARSLIASIMTSGKAEDQTIFKFLSGTREARWLFNADIAHYLDKELYSKALDLQTLCAELEGVPISDERTKNVRKQAEIKKWFNRQFDVLAEEFEPYLRLQH